MNDERPDLREAKCCATCRHGRYAYRGLMYCAKLTDQCGNEGLVHDTKICEAYAPQAKEKTDE